MFDLILLYVGSTLRLKLPLEDSILRGFLGIHQSF